MSKIRSKTEKLVSLYKQVSQIPTLLGAKVTTKSKTGPIIHSVWTQRNLERNKLTKFSKTYCLNSNYETINEFCAVDVSSELLSSLSPSETLRAVFREDTNETQKTKVYLEVWRNDFLWRNVDLEALDLHGTVYVTGGLQSFSWSPDETKLLYVAEKKIPASEPFYKRKPVKKSEDDKKDDKEILHEGSLYRQDWGEQLVGKISSVICIYDITLDTVTVLDNFPEDLFPVQVQWLPSGDGVFGVAFYTLPRKLGLTFCTNRKSEIFTYSLQGEYKVLSNPDRCVRSPRISPKNDYIIWLERPAGGPHHSCMALMKRKLSGDVQPSEVIPVVDTEMCVVNNKKFYGIYCLGLPQKCFSLDGIRIAFSTPQHFYNSICIVNIETGEINLDLTTNEMNQLVLDVNDDIILTTNSNLLTPDHISLCRFPEIEKETHTKWIQISNPVTVDVVTDEGQLVVDSYTFEHLYFTHDNDDDIRTFNGIYFGPKNASPKSMPLLMVPHGGPHSSFVNAFGTSVILYAALGFPMLQVNYRGSTGMGQKALEYLLGRAGDADIKDCILAVDSCLTKYPYLDPDRLILSGGSHGGFIVTHLSGQYPDKFRAVVTRNPVTDICSMYIVSDIPDWCSVEAGAEYTQEGPISKSLMIAQREASPIVHAHKVKAPTLMLIGKKDLRVPPSQGMEFYFRIKANGATTKMHVYDDNHSLATVPVEIDAFINAVLWFWEHLEK